MDHREGVFGECNGPDGAFDIGRFAERLLLFERVALRSVRLQELSAIARAVGVDGLTRLLNSGTLTLDCNAYGIGNRDQEPFNYCVQTIYSPDAIARVGSYLDAVFIGIPGLRQVERTRLGNAVERRVVALPPGFGVQSHRALRADLAANLAVIHEAAVLAASAIVGMKIRPSDLKLQLHLLDDDGQGTRCTAESNLLQIGLSVEQAHTIIRGAVLAVAGTEHKLEQMKMHQSICSFRPSDVAVLDAKINFAWSQVVPDAQEKRLARVLQIAGFPDFTSAAAGDGIDFSRLLAARESDECIAFRRWLRTTDDASDEALEGQLSSIRTKLAAAARGAPGKIVRVATTTAIGAIPVVGLVAGAVASALDTFLVEKVLPKPGPTAFLDDAVRSILKE